MSGETEGLFKSGGFKKHYGIRLAASYSPDEPRGRQL